MIELKPAINEVKLTLKSISSPINLGTVLEPSGGGGSCVPTEVRQAIYTLLDNAAYATTGLEDEIAIVQAWAQDVTALTLSATSLSLNNSTPQTLVATVVPVTAEVVWSSSDESIATVSNGVVTGVNNGSCVITATAGGKTANCAVTVSGFATLESISAVYTPSSIVYADTPLNDLKADLVVTATYDDTSTKTIPDTSYSLSGTLAVGTSTVTVTYSGKTTTFNVSVSTKFAFRNAYANNTTVESTGGLSFAAMSQPKRAGFDPAAQLFSAGTYKITCPTAYYFGLMGIKVSGSSPDVTDADYTWDGTAPKTFWSGTGSTITGSGWQNGTYTFTLAEDAVVTINFKVGSAGSTNFNSTHLADIKNNFKVTRTA